MSSDFAVRACGVGKMFRIYASPMGRVLEAASMGRIRRHEEFWALSGASFDIRRGESVGLIGLNGSGKSTLLQMVSGIMEPTAGRIELNGRLAALLELGAGFSPDFSGRENAVINATLLGATREEAVDRLPWIEQFAGIGDFIDRPVRSYSSGMFVRLAFAVAASVRPDILIVDEALAVGDAAFQQKCYAHMRGTLADAAKIVVTHDLSALSAVTERTIVLHRGSVAFIGPTAEAIKTYHQLSQSFRNVRPGKLSDAADVKPPVESLSHDETELPEIPEACKSGLREIDLLRAATLVNGERSTVAMPGDLVTVVGAVQSAKGGRAACVFGVTLSDRFGQKVCGQYTLSLDGRAAAVDAGESLVQISFRMPRLQSGEYLVTLGVGEVEPDNPMVHDIQCWANNCLSLTCANSELMHGLFNMDLDGFHVEQPSRRLDKENE